MSDLDRAVHLDLGEPKPSWLRSKDHTKFARAMLECQHPAGLCGSDGYCHRWNSCFSSVNRRVDALVRMRDEIDRRIHRLLNSLDGEA